jgi:HSP20 family molecular chaperone IbpA
LRSGSDADRFEFGHQRRTQGRQGQVLPAGAADRLFPARGHIQAAIARDKVTATMRDGVLEVVMPKADESKPKKINIASV